jgi:photosystem II stability/assembly factor-like uncharacterized protein
MNKYLLLFWCSTQLIAQKPTWELQAVDTKASFRAVHAFSEKIVWIGGTSGTFVHTSDGGQTWQKGQVAGAQQLDFRDVQVIDDQTVLLMSAGEAEKGQARIFRTNDGGKTWQLVFESQEKGVFLDGLAFWDRQRGVLLGDPIVGRLFLCQTTDGGQTWQRLPSSQMPELAAGEAHFAASGTSVAVTGKSSIFVGTGGVAPARVMTSHDGGQTWQSITTTMPASASSGIFGLHFWNEKEGMAVGGDYEQPQKNAPLLLTRDGGQHWQSSDSLVPAGLKEALVRLSDGTFLSVGPTGSSYQLPQSEQWQSAGEPLPLHALSSAGQTAWGVGSKGLIVKWVR